MADASLWLVEIGAHTGSATTTLRYSSGGYTTRPGDNPANTTYEHVIGSVGSFEEHLFGRGRTIGPAEIALNEVVLVNANGRLDPILNYGVDGRTVTLKRIGGRRAQFSSAQVVVVASAESIDGHSGMAEFRLRFYDRRRDIDKPIQTNVYGGTTTSSGESADGTEDMKGQLKPLLFGSVRNMLPVVANPFDLILQVNDGAVSFIQLYDGGAPLIRDADYPTLAALRAATVRPGHFATCYALGLCRPGGSDGSGRAFHVWTADVVEGATLALRSAGAVVQRMLAKMGITGGAVNAASFAALQSVAPQEVGVVLANETSGLSAMRQVLGSVGAALIPNRAGQFVALRLAAPGVPAAVLNAPKILTAQEDIGVSANPDTDGNLPAARILLKWGRNWHVHSPSEIATCAADRTPFLTSEWREARVEDLTVLDKHLLAPDLTIETCLANEADADAEAARRAGLYGVTRYVTEIEVDRTDAEDLPLNSTASVVLNRFGFDGGRNMVVIGRDDRFDGETVNLTLWG